MVRFQIRLHPYIFDDYYNLCSELYKNAISFDKFEPVLRKLHTYRDASYMLVALKNVILPLSLYQTHELAEKTKNAKIIYFNEAEQTMLVQIKSYKAMQALGSRVWCIFNSYSTYLQYTFPFRNFYIYYDVKSLYRDVYEKHRVPHLLENTMIGITVGWFGQIRYAHDGNDRSVKHTSDRNERIQAIFDKNKKFLKGKFS